MLVTPQLGTGSITPRLQLNPIQVAQKLKSSPLKLNPIVAKIINASSPVFNLDLDAA